MSLEEINKSHQDNGGWVARKVVPVGGTIRVLIADDHAVVREGLRVLVERDAELELAGTAGDGFETIELIKQARPDVVVLDLRMPRMDGLSTIATIRETAPQTRILVLTGFADEDLIYGALRGGALGFLLKDSSPQEVLLAIRRVARGEVALDMTIAQTLLQEPNQGPAHSTENDALTERETEILRLVAGGLSNQEIADRCMVSERTVRTHVSSILGKLGLQSRTQAALYALRQGIAQL